MLNIISQETIKPRDYMEIIFKHYQSHRKQLYCLPNKQPMFLFTFNNFDFISPQTKSFKTPHKIELYEMDFYHS